MTDREPKRAPTSCIVAGPGGLGLALAVVERFARDEALGANDSARLMVIAEELVANLFDHGGLAAIGAASLSLARLGNAIRIDLSDPCPPFDPRDARRRAEHDARGGGAGIDLVLAWADTVDYVSDIDGNRLTLRVRLRD